jgi:hypothetical protein
MCQHTKVCRLFIFVFISCEQACNLLACVGSYLHSACGGCNLCSCSYNLCSCSYEHVRIQSKVATTTCRMQISCAYNLKSCAYNLNKLCVQPCSYSALFAFVCVKPLFVFMHVHTKNMYNLIDKEHVQPYRRRTCRSRHLPSESRSRLFYGPDVIDTNQITYTRERERKIKR